MCLLGIVFFALGFNGGPQAFLLELVAMIAVAINACALGLLLSTVVVSAEAAMAPERGAIAISSFSCHSLRGSATTSRRSSIRSVALTLPASFSAIGAQFERPDMTHSCNRDMSRSLITRK